MARFVNAVNYDTSIDLESQSYSQDDAAAVVAESLFSQFPEELPFFALGQSLKHHRILPHNRRVHR